MGGWARHGPRLPRAVQGRARSRPAGRCPVRERRGRQRQLRTGLRCPEQRTPIGTLVFTIVPGSADDDTNLALGRKLRGAGIATYLPARGTVASGGTDLFLSGVRRIVERGARVGVHSWSTDNSSVPSAVSLPRDHPEHEKHLNYYRDMGIPEDFYWFTLRAAPPDGMHWMTEEEMAR